MEKVKTLCYFPDRAVHQLTGSQPDHQGRPGNLTHLFNSLCTQSEFSHDSRTIHHHFQYSFNYHPAFHTKEEF